MNFTSVTAASGLASTRPDYYQMGISYNGMCTDMSTRLYYWFSLPLSPVTNPRGINFFAVSTLNLNASDTGLFFLTVNYTNPADPNSLKPVLQLRTNSIANFKCTFNDYHMLV